MEIVFMPLLVREVTTRLTVNSAQLGIYIYDLSLKSTPAGNEKPMQFKVGLGSRQTQTFRFQNFSKTKTEYQCKVDSVDFIIEKTLSAPAGKFINFIYLLLYYC